MQKAYESVYSEVPVGRSARAAGTIGADALYMVEQSSPRVYLTGFGAIQIYFYHVGAGPSNQQNLTEA